MHVDGDKPFRELCQENGIAMTHQRQVLYEVMKTMHGHPSPEEVYARVKKKVPAISLATVYKNIHLFVESGVFQKVSMHHGSVRVEMNREPHQMQKDQRCRRKGARPGGQAQSAARRLPGRAVCSGRNWCLRGLPAWLVR